MSGVAHRLKTPRLTLSPLGAGDVDAIVAGCGNYDVARWLAVVPYPYAEDDARGFLASPAAAPGLTWGIRDAAGLVGVISIRMDPGGSGDVGYWLARDAWGQGYLTEAGDALVDAWFERRAARDLTAGYFVGNDRSASALRKLGFVDEGPSTTRSVALGQAVPSRRMRLTRDAWRAGRRLRLTGPRLRLRELRDTDWRAVQRIGGRPEVARMMLSVTAPWPEDAVRDWIAVARWRGRPGFRAAVTTRAGRIVGVVGLGPVRGGRAPSVAYMIDPARSGRGYASEAMDLLLSFAIPRFDLAEVAADHFADNPASGRVLEKLGFRRTGLGRGHSAARLEPAPLVLYRLDASLLKAAP